MEARFVSLMNTRRFQITAAQLKQLRQTTMDVVGAERVSFFLLTDANVNTGLAKFVKDGCVYQAARLLSNGRWYLTGDYTFA
jgi:hypothetical protein